MDRNAFYVHQFMQGLATELKCQGFMVPGVPNHHVFFESRDLLMYKTG
jgi:hypothetical protein